MKLSRARRPATAAITTGRKLKTEAIECANGSESCRTTRGARTRKPGPGRSPAQTGETQAAKRHTTVPAVAGTLPSCGPDKHDFKEEYYGWSCTKCGVFYPNTEPLGAWLSPDFESP